MSSEGQKWEKDAEGNALQKKQQDQRAAALF